MTFSDLKLELKGRLNLTSTEADLRLGVALNRHYKRVTASIGMDASRYTTVSATTTTNQQTVTFSGIEKIDRLLDVTTASTPRLLVEVDLHQLRAVPPATGEPTAWAEQSTTSDTVVIRLDTIPSATYSLQADGSASLADLTGDDEPAFPASYHDILTDLVMAEENVRKEKLDLAMFYQQRAEQKIAELRFQYADSPTKRTRQGDTSPRYLPRERYL